MSDSGELDFTNSGSPHRAPEAMGKVDFTESGSESGSPRRAPKSIENAFSKVSTFKARNKGSSKADVRKESSQLPKGGGKGKRCHPCRQFRECWAQCSQCPVTFCGRCLELRHGENVFIVSKPGLLWVCPKCRRGCGPGCEKSCCTCSRCPLYKQNQARGNVNTKFLFEEVKSAGFDNLHDYLIHCETGESKEEIAKRKCSRWWITADKSQHEYITTPDSLEDSKKKRQKVVPEIYDSPGDMEMNPKQSTYDYGCGHSLKAEIDLGTLRKDLQNSLVAFGDMAVDLYLMGLWFSRAKEFQGNQMLINLSDKEVSLKNAIKARSSAKPIAFEFGSNSFIDRPQSEQKDMKQRCKETLRSELADSKTRLHQFYQEVDQLIAKISPTVKSAIDLTIETMTEAVEMAVDAIPCNSAMQDSH